MFLTIILVVGFLGQLSTGTPPRPLEVPSSDLGQFFKERIVGGSDAADGWSPHMAALVVGHSWQSFVCGGSIITDCHILTAAHCITSFIQWGGELLYTFHAIVGTNSWHSGTIVDFKGYELHSGYDSWMIKNDVGVLVARKKIKMNERVAPISLDFSFVEGGEKSYVTGWGTQWLWGPIPDSLQKLNVTVLDIKKCTKLAEEAAALWGGWAPPIDDILEICTFHSAGHGMCHGDSGSALVSWKSRLQTGIVSWGYPCAIGGPDVFARVRSAKKFILQAIKNNSCCGPRAFPEIEPPLREGEERH